MTELARQERVSFENLVRSLAMCAFLLIASTVYFYTGALHWYQHVAVALCLALGLAVYGSGSVSDRSALKQIFIILVLAVLYARICYGDIYIESCIVSSNAMSPANLTEIIGTSNITHASTKTTECIKFILYPRNFHPSHALGLVIHNAGNETQYTVHPIEFIKTAQAISRRDTTFFASYLQWAGEFLRDVYSGSQWEKDFEEAGSDGDAKGE
jgi:hypothetical protein